MQMMIHLLRAVIDLTCSLHEFEMSVNIDDSLPVGNLGQG